MSARAPALTQRRLLVTQSFDVLPDYYLRVRARTPSQHNEVRLDLFDLSPYTTTVMHSSRVLLWGSCVFWLLALIVSVLGLISGFANNLEAIIIWSVLALVSSLAYAVSRKTMLVYSHKHTGAVMVAVYLLRHNEGERTQFVKQLNTILERLAPYPHRNAYIQQGRGDTPATKRDLSMLN